MSKKGFISGEFFHLSNLALPAGIDRPFEGGEGHAHGDKHGQGVEGQQHATGGKKRAFAEDPSGNFDYNFMQQHRYSTVENSSVLTPI